MLSRKPQTPALMLSVPVFNTADAIMPSCSKSVSRHFQTGISPLHTIWTRAQSPNGYYPHNSFNGYQRRVHYNRSCTKNQCRTHTASLCISYSQQLSSTTLGQSFSHIHDSLLSRISPIVADYCT